MAIIKIKKSNLMTSNSGKYQNENCLIRIPEKLMSSLGLSVGKYIEMSSLDGQILPLMVDYAYREDEELDNYICYVTDSVFEITNVEKTNSLKIEKTQEITLGCDPEFFFVDRNNGNLLRANAFLRKYGEVGNDGILVEIRPKPSTTPLGLYENIRRLIISTREILSHNTTYNHNDIMLYGASSYRNIEAGFHLHFGLPNKLLGKKPTNISVLKQVAKVMDYYLGMLSVISEGNYDNKRRTSMYTSYGKPGDFRVNNRTMEYRVVGGNLLRHPTLTLGLISIGAIVVQDIIDKFNSLTYGFKDLHWATNDRRLIDVYPNIANTINTYNCICCPTDYNARTVLNSIIEDIRKMSKYNENSNQTEEFFKSLKENYQYSNDIEENWGNVHYGKSNCFY
jgi:hypothetical protein